MSDYQAIYDAAHIIATLESENAALAEMKAKLREECEAWKDFALHQMYCAVCSEAIADCDIGMPLYHAARKEAK